MAEQQVFIQAEGLKLEALVEDLPGEEGVVVAHPHPLYGGEMHNHVVEAVVQAYHESGYSTLRFNFRGVGRSEGEHENGVGEQKDVKAALEHMASLGKRQIDLAGYSFGAWVSALGIAVFSQARRLIMVSPPLNFVDFGSLKGGDKIQLVIVGGDDDIAGPERIKKALPSWNPSASLHIIEGADHFYGERTEELKSVVRKFLADH